MKNLVIIAILLCPLFASAKNKTRRTSHSSFYSVTATFFKCAEAKSGLCAKDVKDVGNSFSYVSSRQNPTFEVGDCPEFSSQILQKMNQSGTDTIVGGVMGFPIVGTASRADEFVITSFVDFAR
jgi:hypothetical protein